MNTKLNVLFGKYQVHALFVWVSVYAPEGEGRGGGGEADAKKTFSQLPWYCCAGKTHLKPRPRNTQI